MLKLNTVSIVTHAVSFRPFMNNLPISGRVLSVKRPEDQGAGDQGMMFGYACREMDNYMPMSIELAHRLLQELAAVRREGTGDEIPQARRQITGHN